MVFVPYAITTAFYRASADETKVRTSHKLEALRSLRRDISSDSTLFWGRRHTPISPSHCRNWRQFAPTEKKVVS